MAATGWNKLSPATMQMVRDFLNHVTVLHTDDAIMAEAARIRASSFINPPKIRLPDAVVLATANVTGRLLVTRNRKDFRGPNVRFPYELQDTEVISVAKPPAATD
jgi:predicted nucleic acid-binding protein